MPEGLFSESPPESNRTPFPISAICIFASGLYCPVRKYGSLTEPCATPRTPPKLFFSSHSLLWISTFISLLDVSNSTCLMKYSGDLSKAGVFIKSLTQKIESLLFIDDSTSNESLKLISTTSLSSD